MADPITPVTQQSSATIPLSMAEGLTAAVQMVFYHMQFFQRDLQILKQQVKALEDLPSIRAALNCIASPSADSLPEQTPSNKTTEELSKAGVTQLRRSTRCRTPRHSNIHRTPYDKI